MYVQQSNGTATTGILYNLKIKCKKKQNTSFITSLEGNKKRDSSSITGVSETHWLWKAPLYLFFADESKKENKMNAIILRQKTNNKIALHSTRLH